MSASRALVPLASSVQSLCHLCSSSSQPRSFSSASPRLRHLYPGEEETSLIAKLRPQVSLFIGYVVPVGYLLPDQYPTGMGMCKNLYPRQLMGMETGWIFRSGEENVPAIPDGYIPVAILSCGGLGLGLGWCLVGRRSRSVVLRTHAHCALVAEQRGTVGISSACAGPTGPLQSRYAGGWGQSGWVTTDATPGGDKRGYGRAEPGPWGLVGHWARSAAAACT